MAMSGKKKFHNRTQISVLLEQEMLEVLNAMWIAELNKGLKTSRNKIVNDAIILYKKWMDLEKARNS